jgi:deferrochelatase/peroxidase EfeB
LWVWRGEATRKRERTRLDTSYGQQARKKEETYEYAGLHIHILQNEAKNERKIRQKNIKEENEFEGRKCTWLDCMQAMLGWSRRKNTTMAVS